MFHSSHRSQQGALLDGLQRSDRQLELLTPQGLHHRCDRVFNRFEVVAALKE
jgi:hypothetical protein